MNRIAMVVVGVVIAASLCFGQAPTSAPAAAIGHGAFPVKVTKTLDSSKVKVDDTIELETAGSFKLPDGTLVPKGSVLTGRVVSVKARSKGDADSELNLAFDKLNIQGGKQLSLKGKVQAIFPPAEEPAGPNMATMGTSKGGSAGGSNLGASSLSGGVGITDTQNDPSKPQIVMDMKATGVQGIRGLELGAGGSILSDGKNVKLGSGVRMIVHVDIFGS